jgi:hypothetical protein
MANCGGQCNLEGCQRPIYSYKADPAGLCQHHHGVWRRFGTTDAGYELMFYELVDRSGGDDECWLWTGGTNGNGYGVYFTIAAAIEDAPVYVHRIAYWLKYGAITESMEIDHICHTQLCVNPKHLRETTVKQNRENRQGADRDNLTGLRGVTALSGDRYRALVVHNHKPVYCGTFKTADEAAEAARAKRIELFTHNDVDRVGR